MKILHITGDFKWTGPAEPMLNAVLGLRARGHEVDLACPAPPPELDAQLLHFARERGVEPVHLLDRRRGYRPLRDRDEIRRLRGLLEHRGYDVVHAHHTRDHLLSVFATRHLPTRLAVSWHHGDPIPSQPWHRLLFGPRRADGLVMLSPRLAKHATRGLGWPPSRVAVVPGSVDAEHFVPCDPSASHRREFGLDSGARVVGVVARLQPHRRFELLLEGFSRALRRAPSLRLLVLGRGTRAHQVLHQPVAELGLEEAVIQAGHRVNDYREVLSLVDALVFLVPGSDGSCRALLEAMSMGIPGIVSRRGVLPETVRDHETGRVVSEDPDELAAAFHDLWRDPARWRAFGKAARESILAHHTIARAARRLERFYGALARGTD
jgi:glycosyltransferase involved in cell wall biosynthesis